MESQWFSLAIISFTAHYSPLPCCFVLTNFITVRIFLPPAQLHSLGPIMIRSWMWESTSDIDLQPTTYILHYYSYLQKQSRIKHLTAMLYVLVFYYKTFGTFLQWDRGAVNYYFYNMANMMIRYIVRYCILLNIILYTYLYITYRFHFKLAVEWIDTISWKSAK